MKTFTAYIEWNSETQLCVGTIPGVHTQGAALDELRGNFKEVLELCRSTKGHRRPAPFRLKGRSPEGRFE